MMTTGFVAMGVALNNGSVDGATAVGSLSFLAPGVTFPVVGLIVALRRPDHPAGWFMLVIGAF